MPTQLGNEMRLLSFVAQLVMVWIPLAVAVLLFGFAFYVRSPAPAVHGGIIVLVVALYKAIEWGVSTRAKTKKVIATDA